MPSGHPQFVLCFANDHAFFNALELPHTQRMRQCSAIGSCPGINLFIHLLYITDKSHLNHHSDSLTGTLSL